MKGTILVTRARRIGIYPGSFNPLHEGHIAFAKKAMQELSLDEVVFLPEAQPRSKHSISPLKKRLRQIQHVIYNERSLSVLTIRDETFSVETTLPELREMFTTEVIYLLVGSDVAKFVHTWPHVDKLCKEVTFVVGLRGDDTQQEVDSLLGSIGARYHIFESDYPHLASSKITGLSRAAGRLLVDFSS